MKIFKNIVLAVRLIESLRCLEPYKSVINKSREDGDFEQEREYILRAMTHWGSYIVDLFKIDLHVTGKENLPDKGPVVFAANHQGYADIPVTSVAFDKFQFAYIARDELEMVPFYGKWMHRIRSIFIKRGDNRAALKTISDGIELLENGFSLLIFPEGTRSRGRPAGEFKKGSLRLATKPGVPVIPVTIDGTYCIFEEQGYIRNGVRVDIVIHPAIETKGMDKLTANNLASEVETIVKSVLHSQ